MKPKFKPGDKVKVTLELTIKDVNSPSMPYYSFKGNQFNSYWSPDCKPFDKIAKLIPARKKIKKRVANMIIYQQYSLNLWKTYRK